MSARATIPREDALLHALARKVGDQTAELERLRARLRHDIGKLDAQLAIARAALDREIEKRVWAEHELTQANLRLSEQVVRDPLTGLYNRRYLQDSLSREESRARRLGRPFGVIMVDIDNFKRFNDQLGHAAGDAVLRAAARLIVSVARGEDIVSRFGGDEIVVVMSQASLDTLLERAEALRAGMSRLTIEHDGRRIGPVTLSAGIGVFPDHGETGEAVLKAADDALYRAKREGRDRVVMGAGAATI
jgi:diguanylate cyclase (GGDEF)-like protein